MKQVANNSLLKCCKSKTSLKAKTKTFSIDSIASGLN